MESITKVDISNCFGVKLYYESCCTKYWGLSGKRNAEEATQEAWKFPPCEGSAEAARSRLLTLLPSSGQMPEQGLELLLVTVSAPWSPPLL